MTTGRPILVTATAVLAASPAKVGNVNLGVAAAGQTIKLHDCAATGDAAAGNLKGTFATDAVFGWELDAYFAVGVVAVVSGGTPVATVTVG